MLSVCDRCVYCDQICLATKSRVKTVNDEIVSCSLYSFNPAIQLEHDVLQALQELVRRGRIAKAFIIRSRMQLGTATVPNISQDEIIELMRHGEELKEK